MIAWGTMAAEARTVSETARNVWALTAAGITLALYIFMADSLQQLPRLKSGMIYLLPTDFNWPLFIAALVLMSAPLVAISVRRGPTRAVPGLTPACPKSELV